MNSELSVIIPAAGSGARMNAPVPKAFLTFSGKTMLEHTMDAFAALEELRTVVVAVPGDHVDRIQQMLSRAYPGLIIACVSGGQERRDSVYRALGRLSGGGLVAVHDAARPFVSPGLIRSVMEMAKRQGAAVPALRATDTLKRADEHMNVAETLDRERVWMVQTPQIFQRQVLVDAYEAAVGWSQPATDDASLVEQAGGTVALVEGEHRNIKITWPDDLRMAEWLVREYENGR